MTTEAKYRAVQFVNCLALANYVMAILNSLCGMPGFAFLMIGGGVTMNLLAVFIKKHL